MRRCAHQHTLKNGLRSRDDSACEWCRDVWLNPFLSLNRVLIFFGSVFGVLEQKKNHVPAGLVQTKPNKPSCSSESDPLELSPISDSNMHMYRGSNM